MSIITRTMDIDMGHRVPNHKSKCKNLHGHRYNIEVAINDKIISTKGDSSEGMVLDFTDLQKIMTNVIDLNFDHGFCMYKHDIFAPIFKMLMLGEKLIGYLDVDYTPQKIIFVDFIPTAENLSKHWFKLLNIELEKIGLHLYYIKVWETRKSTALYSRQMYEDEE